MLDNDGKIKKITNDNKLSYENSDWSKKEIANTQELNEMILDVREITDRYGSNWPKNSVKFLKIIWISHEVRFIIYLIIFLL